MDETGKRSMDERRDETARRYRETRLENIRKRREERQREIENGARGERRMAFLDEILKAKGYSVKRFARACGMNPQKVFWWLTTADDASYAAVRDSLRIIGVGLDARLTPKTPRIRIEKAGGIGRSMADSETERMIASRRSAETNTHLKRCLESGGRLSFLAEYIIGSGLSLHAVSRLSGIEMTSLRLYLQNDNLKISAIYRIAESLDADITWLVSDVQDGERIDQD